VISWKGKNGQSFWDIAFQPIGELGSALRIFLNCLAQLGFGLARSGALKMLEYLPPLLASCSGEAHTGWRSAADRQAIGSAARGCAENRFAGCLQPYVGIADDQLHTVQASLHRLCRKSRQCSSCSPSETETPRIRRLPSRFTPLAISTAASWICRRFAPFRTWRPGIGRRRCSAAGCARLPGTVPCGTAR